MFILITTVDACDKSTIPSVEHALYSISEENDGGDFATPDGVNITYACEDGYKLQDPNNRVVGCEFIPTPGDEQDGVNRRVRWTDTDGIVCIKGKSKGYGDCQTLPKELDRK